MVPNPLLEPTKKQNKNTNKQTNKQKKQQKNDHPSQQDDNKNYHPILHGEACPESIIFKIKLIQQRSRAATPPPRQQHSNKVTE